MKRVRVKKCWCRPIGNKEAGFILSRNLLSPKQKRVEVEIYVQLYFVHLWGRILFVFKGGRFTEDEKGGGAYVAVSTLENLCDILALPVSDQMR